MKTFQVPTDYRSPLISAVKNKRRSEDKMKKDFSPSFLDFGTLHIYLARHFGFCYGVENAIDIAFRIVDENPGKNIFLLSEMIHNPRVNQDLERRGIRFLQDTRGKQLISFDTLQPEDIVITPAFGTSLEIEALLKARGIQTKDYNTTCPFVEKVWNRSSQIAEKKFTVIIHGKPDHEETRATFSHASAAGPALVIRDLESSKRGVSGLMKRPLAPPHISVAIQAGSPFRQKKNLLCRFVWDFCRGEIRTGHFKIELLVERLVFVGIVHVAVRQCLVDLLGNRHAGERACFVEKRVEVGDWGLQSTLLEMKLSIFYHLIQRESNSAY